MDNMEVGKIFKIIRTSRNIPQNKMAEKLGISQNYLSLIESEKKQPSIDVISALAETTNISRKLCY